MFIRKNLAKGFSGRVFLSFWELSYKNGFITLFLAKVVQCSKVFHKCGALRDLVPFVQFKKREKTPMEEC